MKFDFARRRSHFLLNLKIDDFQETVALASASRFQNKLLTAKSIIETILFVNPSIKNLQIAVLTPFLHFLTTCPKIVTFLRVIFRPFFEVFADIYQSKRVFPKNFTGMSRLGPSLTPTSVKLNSGHNKALNWPIIGRAAAGVQRY